MNKRQVVIGFLGTTLDAGKYEARWERWRPTVALCQHDDLVIDRLELIHDNHGTALAKRITDDIKLVSPETTVRPQVMNLKDAWDFEEVYGALLDFARGYHFDTAAEDYLINITTGTHVAQICWYLLTEAHYLPARLLQVAPPRKRGRQLPGTPDGAGIVNPQDSDPGSYSVIDLDLSRYDRIATRFKAEQIEATSFLKSGIATRNDAFNRMIDEIEQVAVRSKAPLLLSGPTGAGKSHLARRIYELRKARHQIAGPFVEVNCATLRGDGAMSALFGHVKGAFTGALKDRDGLLRAADGGMLFLDEIGELGLDEQAMILRAIEEKRFMPLGADKERSSDFQLIAGTNRDLWARVGEGTFREDLLARLSLWTFHLPGLADRREDIEPNIDFELQRYAEREGSHVAFNREARDTYLGFVLTPEARWSGNFRDLGASITRMATLAPAGRINTDVVVAEIARLRRIWSDSSEDQGEALLRDVVGAERLAAIDPFDRLQLAGVLRLCRQHKNLSSAGRALFAASRLQKASSNDADRLRKYLARFDLDWQAVTGG